MGMVSPKLKTALLLVTVALVFFAAVFVRHW
jgi:hypothetical protein